MNQKVEFRSLATGKIEQYLIRGIETDPMGGTMKLTMVKFYPLYPWADDEQIDKLGMGCLGSIQI